MEQRDRRAAEEEEQFQQSRQETEEAVNDGNVEERSQEEQEATARALRPHSRSLVDLRNLRYQPPEPSAVPPPKRSRKWQFGIRSRNQPYEAILYLYKAIEAQGGVWDIIPAEPENGQTQTDTSSDSKEKPLQRRYSDLPSDHYVPKDPWFIRSRLLKEGIKAPGETSSSRNSRSDLKEKPRGSNTPSGTTTEEKTSTSGTTQSSTGGNNANTGGNNPPSSSSSHLHSNNERVSHGVWVFIDIQLYQLEENNYVVDFKCDGYQNVIRSPEDDEWHPVSKRFKNKEKEVNSPFPFLNVASDLVAQLAVAG